MNKEESIQKIQDQIEKAKEYIEYGMPYGEYLQLQLAFEDIVNLIQKQEKIIDKMAEKLVEDTEWFYSEFDNYTKQDFIEYFKKEVEKE